MYKFLWQGGEDGLKGVGVMLGRQGDGMRNVNDRIILVKLA